MRVVDGPDRILTAVREQLKHGATQIKLMAGGGVTSAYDPLDTLQFTQEELHAAVRAAADWGTYVSVHVFTSDGVRRAVDAGVKSIEHGQLADEETIAHLARKGVWLSTQPLLESDHTFDSADSTAKNRLVCDGGAPHARLGPCPRRETSRSAPDFLLDPASAPSRARRSPASRHSSGSALSRP